MLGERCVFVTVGTTKFDSLIETVQSRVFLMALMNTGYSQLTVQYGHGSSFEPELENIRINTYPLKSDISEDLQNASLVISHAGAGSCLEALSAGKKLIIVVNDTLMGNHQLELARKLEYEGHAVCCTPSMLTEVILNLDKQSFVELQEPVTRTFSRHLSTLL